MNMFSGTCHVLPVLFSFSTPAKFCYRAMASFVKLVTGMPLTSPTSASDSSVIKLTRVSSLPSIHRSESPDASSNGLLPSTISDRQASSSSAPVGANESASTVPDPRSASSMKRRQSLRRTMSTKVTQVNRIFRRKTQKPENILEGITTSDTAEAPIPRERFAGEIIIYENIKVGPATFLLNRAETHFGSE
jgi:hypothetical protein